MKCSRPNRVQQEWNVQEKMWDYFPIIRTRIWQRNQEATNNFYKIYQKIFSNQ